MKRRKVFLLFLLVFITGCKGAPSKFKNKASHKLLVAGHEDKHVPQEYEVSTSGVQGSVKSTIQTSKNQEGLSLSSDTSSYESKEGDFFEDDQRKSSRKSANDNHSPHGGLKVTQHDRPSQSGTQADALQAKTAAHYKIKSAETRWNNVAHLGSGTKDDRRIRFKKRRKARSDLTEEEPVEEDGDEPEHLLRSNTAIIIGAACAGFVVFLCLIIGLACLWKKCKKRCLRRKDLEMGMENAKDPPNDTSEENPSTAPSQQRAASYGDDQAFVVAQSPRAEASVVVDIPEPTFQDTSFACSTLSETLPYLKSGSPLILKQESCATNPSVPECSVKLESETGTQPPSPSSASAMSIKSEHVVSNESSVSLSEITLTFPSDGTPDLTTTPTVPCTATDNPPSPAQPTTPKKYSNSSLFPAASDELMKGFFTTTDSNSSSTESCKTPVAPRDEVMITIENDDDEVIFKSEKSGTENVAMDNDTVTSADKNGSAAAVEYNDNVEPPTPPGPVRPPTASTELRRGKSFIGGQKALENRLFIKHLTSAQHSAGFEDDLNTAISRIVDEKKRQMDINREKRLVIKHQTQETKYSLEESIVRSKSVIMEENVDKSRDRRATRHRKVIKETHCYQDDPWGAPPKTTLEREIRFARAIILPYPRNPSSSSNMNTRRKVVPQLYIGSGRLMRKPGCTNYARPGAMTCDVSGREKMGFAVDLNKFPQKSCLCFKCQKEREKASARFFPPPRKRQSKVLKYKALLAAKEPEQACASLKHAAPIRKGQCSSTSSDVSSCDSRSFSDSGSEDKEQEIC